jgi:hypothetical protein
MTDWSKPTATSLYVPNFIQEVIDRDVDSGTMTGPGAGTPNGFMKFNRGTFGFEEFNSVLGSYVAKQVSVVGGGTGSTTAAGARTNLGIGTLGTQSSSAVAITGGTISGITALTLTGNLTFFADDSYDIGTNAIRPRKAYFRSALVIPVGTNKYATS